MLTSSGRRPEGCGWRGPRGCLRPSVTVAAKETGAPLLTGSSGEGSEGSALPSGTAAGNLPGRPRPAAWLEAEGAGRHSARPAGAQDGTLTPVAGVRLLADRARTPAHPDLLSAWAF